MCRDDNSALLAGCSDIGSRASCSEHIDHTDPDKGGRDDLRRQRREDTELGLAENGQDLELGWGDLEGCIRGIFRNPEN